MLEDAIGDAPSAKGMVQRKSRLSLGTKKKERSESARAVGGTQ